MPPQRRAGAIPATAALAAVVLASSLAAAGPLAGQDPQSAASRWVRISGQVLDRESGEPLAAAAVMLSDSVGLVTDENGRFEFPVVLPGRYTLEVQRLGYNVARDTLDIAEDMNMRLRIRLTPVAVELEPLIVSSRIGMGKMRGFYERRLVGQGSYITREDIEDRGPTLVTRMLDSTRGVRLVPIRNGYDIALRGGCRPALWVDGIRSNNLGLSLDEMFSPADIEGIEVYRGPEVPMQFNRNASCGAVVIWTRVPELDRGRALNLKKALITTGAAVSAALTLLLVF